MGRPAWEELRRFAGRRAGITEKAEAPVSARQSPMTARRRLPFSILCTRTSRMRGMQPHKRLSATKPIALKTFLYGRVTMYYREARVLESPNRICV